RRVRDHACSAHRAAKRRADDRIDVPLRNFFGESGHLLLAAIGESAVAPTLRDTRGVVHCLAVTHEDERVDHCSSDSAVISFGFSMPRSCRSVGATFESAPPSRSSCFFPSTLSSTMMNGTGDVVCAVCGWFVMSSNINSALP